MMKQKTMGMMMSGAPASAPLFSVNLLNSSIARAKGSDVATYTGATTKTIEDFEGLIKPTLSGEMRFKGARRVENLVAASENLQDAAYTAAGGATVDSATQVTFDGTDNADVLQTVTLVDDGGGAASRDFIFSVFIRLVSGTISGDGGITLRVGGNAITAVSAGIGSEVTSSSLRFSLTCANDAAGTTAIPEVECDDNLTLEITKWQFEEITGATVTTPSEYVSVGVGTGDELFSTPLLAASWTPAGTNTVADVDTTTGEVLITYVDNNQGADIDFGVLASTTEDATKTFIVSGEAKVNQNSTNLRLVNAVTAHNLAISSTSFVTFALEVVYDGSGNMTMNTNAMAAGDTINVRNLSVKQVDHGANIDAVQYFKTKNGNTVSSNVVTEAVGAIIGASDSHADASGPFGYLSEGARTNIQIRSELFSNAAWTKAAVVMDANAAVAPDGKTTAERFNVDADANIHDIQDQVTITSAGTTQVSLYAKDDGGRYITLRIFSDTNDWAATTFDLNGSGAVGQNDDGATTGSVTSSSITALPNSWFRLESNMTMQADTSVEFSIAASNTATPSLDTSGQLSFTPSAGEDYFIWGAMVEDNVTFPSSYIPTEGSSVIRNADVLTYDDALNILDAQGTAFAEVSTIWSTSGGSQSFAFGRTTRVLARGSASTPTANEAADGTNTSVSPSGDNAFNAIVKSAATWGGALTAYWTSAPDATPGNYDGTLGSGDFGVGCDGSGSNQWFGTIRNVQIYGKELNAGAVAAL